LTAFEIETMDCVYIPGEGEREFVLYLDLNNYCNQKCVKCPNWPLAAVEGRSSLSAVDFARIGDSLFHHVYSLQIGCMHEPLLCPELGGIIQRLARYEIPHCTIQTNGTCLDDKTVSVILSSPHIHTISISLDGTTDDVYSKMRGSLLMKTVVAGIARIQAGRKARVAPLKVVLGVVVAKSNIDNLADIARLAVESGVDGIWFVHIGPTEATNAESLINDPAKYQRVAGDLRRILEPSRIDFSLPAEFKAQDDTCSGEGGFLSVDFLRDLRTGFSHFKRILCGKRNQTPLRRHEPEAGTVHEVSCGEVFCLNPWYILHVDSQGRVYPCLARRGDGPVGNLIRDGMEDVINSVSMRELRASILAWKPVGVCTSCWINNPWSEAGREPLRKKPSEMGPEF